MLSLGIIDVLTVHPGLHSPCMEVEVIELVKPEHAGLGLIIGSREYVCTECIIWLLSTSQ